MSGSIVTRGRLLIEVAEVVLSVLVESFKFALTEQEILWDMGFVAFARVNSSTGHKAQMPLQVSLA